ncbi:hypothetical protein N431DRAFT_472147 [Stipitochalara longipes BDJ]|nr:hypothetical protein N431DRAFT_472147 [Stipitochalara longipes BDJ]
MPFRPSRSKRLPAPTRVQPPRTCKSKRLSSPLAQVFHFLRLPPEVRCMIYRYLIVSPYPWMLNRKYCKELYDRDLNDKLYLDILCTNRQIFSEASYLLYSETALQLHPEDLVCLRPGAEDIVLPKECIWRHNPLDGIGELGTEATRVYETPEMDGFMEPHVFSRFKYIVLDLYLHFLPREGSKFRRLRIDAQLNLLSDDRVRFREYLLQSNIINDFKEIISHSPVVTILEIYLEIAAAPEFNIHFLDDKGNLSEAYYIAADTRAVEVFIESGVMDSLRSLSNIEEVSMDVLRGWDSKQLTLEPEYEDKLRQLVGDIVASDT